MGYTEVTSHEELRHLLGKPGTRAANKDRAVLHEVDRRWLAASPFCLVATAGADGTCDVSPKGDPPGFTHVVDDTTIAVPERPGNKRADGFHNILDNPHVGLVYFVPGRSDTLRVNGRARLLRDARPYWGKPLAVAGIPYGYRLPAGGPPGLYRIGDQASVIPSFTGEGMALALHSGLAAAAAILAGQSAEAFHAAWRCRSAGPLRWAGAGAWALRVAPAGFAAAAGIAPLARLVARRTRLEG